MGCEICGGESRWGIPEHVHGEVVTLHDSCDDHRTEVRAKIAAARVAVDEGPLLTDAELTEMEQAHVEGRSAREDMPICAYCGDNFYPQEGDWPCDAARLMAEVRRLRALEQR